MENRHIDNSWELELYELRSFFNSVPYPRTPIKLDDVTTINDVSQFIDGHFAIIENHMGKSCFRIYMTRLIKLKEFMETNN